MGVSRILISLALTHGLIMACRSHADRSHKKAPGDDVAAAARDDTDGVIDLALTQDTLARILQEAGGPQDIDCQNKRLASKAHLRLLTSDEYQNSIADILQVDIDYRNSLPSEKPIFGFRNNADISKVSDAHAAAYLDTAIAIADEIKPKLPALVQCREADGESCAQKLIDSLAPKLWRRPLEDREKTALLTLYSVGFASTPREGMSLVITSLLNSPNFLYRSEIGKDGGLGPFELASALSYFFWGSPPDGELRGLAASGTLGDSATLLAQAERLLKSPKSRFASVEFANAWLGSKSVRGVTKDATLYPDFSQGIANAMAVEAEDTFDYLMKQPGAGFDSLFTADFSLGDEKLAQYYKGQAVTENGVSKIKFLNTPRKGVLGLGAVLAHLATATETHPVKRGDFVLTNMFCHIPDPVPAGLNVQIPAATTGLTTRERFAQHSTSPVCSGCHAAIDGIGFGMEDFDGVGLYRDTDSGKKVDSTGELVGIDSTRTPFSGIGELSDYLATSKQAKRCFVVEWYRMAHGYAERPADICAIRDIANSFEKASTTLSQLLIQIVTHASYTQKEL